ncbi:MAG: type II secretion system protein [Candidatus Omnitrophica bacterium]|nr:type II secretion system protein [Candidatus Omnitrophota bacterium]
MLKHGQKIFFKFRSAARGFTLVELIISAAIMAAVIAGILVSYIRCMELNEASQNKSMALKAARSRMEAIKGSDYDNLVANYNGAIFDVTGFVGKGVSYVTVLDAKNTRVIVSVSWRQKNGRVYGEDKNLNGVLGAGEDGNADNMLNSPVDITTRIYKRS